MKRKYEKRSISISPYSQEVLEQARKKWPEEQTLSGLYERILAEWFRQNGGENK